MEKQHGNRGTTTMMMMMTTTTTTSRVRFLLFITTLLCLMLVRMSCETFLLHEDTKRKRILLRIWTRDTPSTATFMVDPHTLPVEFRQAVTTSMYTTTLVPRTKDEAETVTYMTNRTSTSTTITSTKSGLVIFYHIYLPDSDNTNHSMSIVREQLNQIGTSMTLQQDVEAENMGQGQRQGVGQVYYNVIGNQTLDPVIMEQICRANHLQCHKLNQYPTGFEFYTLSDLRKYCRQPSHHNTNVVYMHNKGSYSLQKASSAVHIRRSMTTAVSSPPCHQALSQDHCNLCGLNFSPWKAGPFYPGNFWTAQCQYVRHLVEPHKFQEMSQVNKNSVKQMSRRGKLTLNLFPPIASVFGTGRYAAEYWGGSHPQVRPCDVTSIYHTWETKDLSLLDMDLQRAPRQSNLTKSDQTKTTGRSKTMPTTVEGRIREYFLVAGYIMRWRRYYHAVAPDDSWVWTYFPEGLLWREAVKHHGMRHAVTQMLNNQTYLQWLQHNTTSSSVVTN
jgi:hypothetical protein